MIVYGIRRSKAELFPEIEARCALLSCSPKIGLQLQFPR